MMELEVNSPWKVVYPPEIERLDTQKIAIFEAGDTSSKPSFFGIYVKFGGCT